MLIGAKKFFFFKNSIWVSKNAEFHADFEYVKKGLKKCTKKKLLAKTWRKYALFSLLLMFVKLVLLITFFLVHFFTTFSTDSKPAWNSAFFDTFFDFFKKIFFKGHVSTFFKLWSQTCKKRLKKSKKVLVFVSQISILHPSKGLYSSFSKKKSNSLYPNVHMYICMYICTYHVRLIWSLMPGKHKYDKDKSNGDLLWHLCPEKFWIFRTELIGEMCYILAAHCTCYKNSGCTLRNFWLV